jgi:DUF4097 and DUF4098 domain-containing protein YvlB
MKKMKAPEWNYKTLALIAALVASIPLSGQSYERSRNEREAFRVAPNTEIQVVNKYGDIHMIPWEKDSVVFEISFSVTSKKQEKVDKVFEYIDFEFNSTSYYVSAKTVFKGQNTFWTEVSDVAGTIFSSGTNTRIDYTIYFPEKNDVRLENKFGNIYTTSHSGKVDITLSNGDMKAQSFLGQAKLRLEFGSATIDRISNGSLNLGYFELNLEEAGMLNLESRSSKIYLTRCDEMQINSRRDRYYIKSAGGVTGELFFSNLNLDRIDSKINLKCSYGDIKVLDISQSTGQMDFVAQYSDLTLYLGEDNLFTMDITRDDRSQLISTAREVSRSESPVEGVEKTFRVSLRAGGQGKPVIPVSISTKAGKIYLMNQ